MSELTCSDAISISRLAEESTNPFKYEYVLKLETNLKAPQSSRKITQAAQLHGHLGTNCLLFTSLHSSPKKLDRRTCQRSHLQYQAWQQLRCKLRCKSSFYVAYHSDGCFRILVVFHDLKWFDMTIFKFNQCYRTRQSSNCVLLSKGGKPFMTRLFPPQSWCLCFTNSSATWRKCAKKCQGSPTVWHDVLIFSKKCCKNSHHTWYDTRAHPKKNRTLTQKYYQICGPLRRLLWNLAFEFKDVLFCQVLLRHVRFVLLAISIHQKSVAYCGWFESCTSW